MRILAKTLGRTLTLAIVMLWAAEARATQSLYTSQCASCHSTGSTSPNTCNGCHYHGTHSSSAASDINLKGTTDKTSYAPGETVKVTINGGYRTGWVRAVLYDQTMKQLASGGCAGGMGGCTTGAFPITLSVPAPSTAGSYVWAISWYGNQYETAGGSMGSGNSSTLKVGFFTLDANNSGHGSQTVALPAFTVTAPTSAPAVALNPTSLSFGTVNVGSSKALSAQVQNTGTAPLNVTGITMCSGTPASITWTPAAPLTVAAGGSTSLNVTFAPTAASALPTGACLTLASNDPAKPTINLTLSGTGATVATPPAIALNPTSLAFGTVNVGATSTLTAQVQNTGGSPLNVTSISRCTGTPTSVTWTPTASFSVAAAGSASLNVSFAPTAAGALPTGACLTLASNDAAKPTINLTLTGTGATPPAGPAIALNPASLTFGTVNVGATSALTAQVQNPGGSPLNVTSISRCAGTPTSVTWSPTASFTVAAAGTASLNVSFAPTAAGALPTGACLTIASNDPVKPTINLTLSGTGATPTIALNPTALAFGTVNVGATSTITAQVQNTGGSALNVTSISRCTGTPTSVTWSPTGSFSVAAAGSTSLNVTYAPTAAGALPTGACLTLASNDPARPTINLALTGTGATVPTAPAIALSPASLDFQTVLVGHSTTLTAQVLNTGNAPLNVSRATPCAGTPASVSFTPTTSFTVAAGGSATLNVTFAPTASGALPSTACLSFTSNDPANPSLKLALAGTATNTSTPVIALDPGTLDFATVVVNTSKKLTTLLKNTGNATLNVTSIGPCSGTPASLSWNATVPASVAPGASIPVSVFFAPSAAGELPAGSCLRITSSDPSNPTVEIAVTGSGSATGGAGEVPPAWGCSTGGSESYLAIVGALLFITRRKQRRAGALAR